MLIFAGCVLFIFLLMQPFEVWHYNSEIATLFTKGPIALKERNLLLILQAIMLLVVIPVFILTFVFSWVYRAHNSKAKYDPDWYDHPVAEVIWWGIPCLIVIAISIFTAIRTYELDPFRPIQSDKKHMTIQVVALQWKWLFIYPEEKIASVNFFQFPEKTPITFEITADAPMNSFWIPQLSGQIYAMPSMKTRLHLVADEVGDYRGSSANISGEGFAGMTFTARASTEEDFHQWVQSVKQSPNGLDFENYEQLARPSKNNPIEVYLLKQDNLFEEVLMKFMHPTKE